MLGLNWKERLERYEAMGVLKVQKPAFPEAYTS